MLAHLQVGLSQILAPDHGRRLRSSPNTVKAKGAKTLPESGTRHRSVGGAMPICVFTQKANLCSGTKLDVCAMAQKYK